MKALAAILEKLDDRINPIAVKELRQAVQAKYISGLLLLLLVGQLVVMAVVVLSRSRFGLQGNLGRGAFSVLYTILVGTCTLFVPAYVAGQLFMLRGPDQVELLSLTVLRPRSLVWGRLASGVTLSLLIHSTFAPFLVLSYMLRGIDLDVIMVLIVLGFSGSVVMIAFAIFLACVPAPRPVKPLFGLLILGGAGFATMGALAMAAFVGATGWLSIPLSEFWGAFGILMGSGAGLVGLFFVLSLALVSPRAANRAPAVRIYLTALWLVSLAVAVVWAADIQEEYALGPWKYACVALFCFCMLFAAGEREAIGPRVARTIPRGPVRRRLAFLFYSGSAGGITWASLMLFLTLLAGFVWHVAIPERWRWYFEPGDYFEFIGASAGLALFAFAYANTGIALRRAFCPARPPSWTWVLIAVVVAASLVPGFVGGLITYGRYRPNPLGLLYTCTPVALTNNYAMYRPAAILVAAAWAVIAGILNRAWYVRQLRGFRRREPVERMAPAAEETALKRAASEPAGGSAR